MQLVWISVTWSFLLLYLADCFSLSFSHGIDLCLSFAIDGFNDDHQGKFMVTATEWEMQSSLEQIIWCQDRLRICSVSRFPTGDELSGRKGWLDSLNLSDYAFPIDLEWYYDILIRRLLLGRETSIRDGKSQFLSVSHRKQSLLPFHHHLSWHSKEMWRKVGDLVALNER